MKQSFSYSQSAVKKAMKLHHGIDNVDLLKNPGTIENMLLFLKLDDFIEVTEYFGGRPVTFTLQSKPAISVEDFRLAVLKLQDHIECKEVKTKPQEVENIIEEIKLIVSAFPSDFDIVVGTTYDNEQVAKTDNDLPHHWHFRSMPNIEIARTVRRYFARHGYVQHYVQQFLFIC